MENVTGGALVALSLDGQPLTKSRKFLVKMASDARNTDEVLGRDPRFARQKTAQFKLNSIGSGPVGSSGKPSTLPMEIRLNDLRLLQLWQTGSAWELLVDGGQMTFWCDAPGARFRLGTEKSSGSWRLIGAKKSVQISNSPFYPAGALGVQTLN